MRFVRNSHFCIVLIQRYERLTSSFEYIVRGKPFRCLTITVIILFYTTNCGISEVDSIHRIVFSASIPIYLNNIDNNIVIFAKNQVETYEVEDVIGIAGREIPLKIKIYEDSSPNKSNSDEFTFLMFRGLPEGFRLSSGFRSGKVFIVSIKERLDLRLIVPVDYAGQFRLQVLLYRGSDARPVERTVSVAIAGTGDSAPGTTQQSITSAELPPVNQPQTEETPKLSPDHEAEMLAEGQDYVQTGNIVFARLIFEDLAVQGSARGAFALAQTYDPQFLRNLPIVGLQPDIEKAKEWYRKAAQLGSQSASERLAAMSGSGS